MGAMRVDSNRPSSRILFVDAEEQILGFVQRNLPSLGYRVVTSPSWDEAKNRLRQFSSRPQVIFVEPYSTNGNNRVSVREICSEAQQIPVVVVSHSRDPRTIVEAIRSGARRYLCKPFEVGHLQDAISDLTPSRTNSKLCLPGAAGKVEFICRNPRTKRIYETILQIADTKVPALLLGESGVGKDLVARMIHEKSRLADKPFVKVNCAALPAELVESELFGHRKGAFTGAHVDRVGKFEFANGGTIFLDEIGELPPSIQAKLLHVLQDGSFMRLGSNRETAVDVRVIVATNRNLEEALQNGTFREDLYYRLNVVKIEVPPLRQRREEIGPLCEFFLQKFGADDCAKALPEDLAKAFQSYHWPGNVRELENLIKRYLVLGDAESIRAELESRMGRGIVHEINDITETYLEENGDKLDLMEISRKAASLAERNMILKALRRANWNKWKAGKELKVSYKTLLTKIEEYKIKPSE